jgi:hypothetical protein
VELAQLEQEVDEVQAIQKAEQFEQVRVVVLERVLKTDVGNAPVGQLARQ